MTRGNLGPAYPHRSEAPPPSAPRRSTGSTPNAACSRPVSPACPGCSTRGSAPSSARCTLGTPPRFPARLEDFLAVCHEHGQRRPTPLLLLYEAGGHNTLHQDVHGEVTFPLQVVIGLSGHGDDYTGGELVVVDTIDQVLDRVLEPAEDRVLVAPR